MQRRAITVSGIVQGVGFRPFVFGLATRLQLTGFARNDARGVIIEVQGTPSALDEFLAALTREAPTLARIEAISSRVIPPQDGAGFEIRESDSGGHADVFISPDVATCGDCLRELFDPADRRYRYPFINCTNCGPRLTIVTGAPYDRASTTMASFTMCEECRVEYEDPLDRRFHAQPIACAICGPQLRLLDQNGELLESDDSLRGFAGAILSGQIGALKGLGGFHLVCDATNEHAVQRLRSRKHREEKPFAVMFRDVALAAAHCHITAAEEELLRSRAAPIVLLRPNESRGVADSVAPANPLLGVVLPYTPIHHLLVEAVNQVPLVMTSGNRSDEPIARENDEAVERLRGIADVFLVHDRPIHVRCDDSVTRIVAGQELPIRRSRGYAPLPINVPFTSPAPILAVGGQLKGTFALARQNHVFLSHHLGDLDHHQAYVAFESDIALYRELFQFDPAYIAHDLHPDYASTRYAQATGLPLIAVQHHHAHMASCMAENSVTEQVIGATFDGLGYGTDGAVWGGEFLVGDYTGFTRVAHLRYVGMPGGDQATREPWRMALAHLRDAGTGCAEFDSRIADTERRVVEQMLERRLNSPMSSSAGRLFDAVASLVGVRDRVSYEGQAAVELEWLATGRAECGSYPYEFCDASNREAQVIDTRPMIRAIVADVQKKTEQRTIARRFHSTLASMITEACQRISRERGIRSVVLSGGVFVNALLTREVLARLDTAELRIYRHRHVPSNDAGLGLGQAAIAAARLKDESHRTIVI